MKQKKRCIVHLDMDAFYAQVESVRLGIDSRVQPYALEQWNNFLAVNYPAREWFGIERMDSVGDAQKKVLEYHRQKAEHLLACKEDLRGSTSTITTTPVPPTITAALDEEARKCIKDDPYEGGKSSQGSSPSTVGGSVLSSTTAVHRLEGALQPPSPKASNASFSFFSGTCVPVTPPQMTVLYSPIPLYRVGETEYAYYPPNAVDTEVGDVLHASKTPLPRTTAELEVASVNLTQPSSKSFCHYNRNEFKVSLEPFRAASKKIFTVLRSFSGVHLAKAGTDEAFLDVTEAAEAELRHFLKSSFHHERPSFSSEEQQRKEQSVQSSSMAKDKASWSTELSSSTASTQTALPWTSLTEICDSGLLEPSTLLVEDKSVELDKILKEKGTSLRDAYEIPMQWLRENLQAQECETDSNWSETEVAPSFKSRVRTEEEAYQSGMRFAAVFPSVMEKGKTKAKTTSKEGTKGKSGERDILSSLSPHLSLDYFFPSELNPSVLFGGSPFHADDGHDENSAEDEAVNVPRAATLSSADARDSCFSTKSGVTTSFATKTCVQFSSHHLTATEIDFLSYCALLAAASRVVTRIRETLYATVHFDCSAGIAHNCLAAKILSASHKPRKQVLLWPHLTSSAVGFTRIAKMRGFGGKQGNLLTRYNSQLRAVEVWDRHLFNSNGFLNAPFLSSFSRDFNGQFSPLIRDPYSFFRVRGADSNQISPPKLPHMWSSLKEFPKPKLIRQFSQLERWMGALCHDVWCRHRYYEDDYRQYFPPFPCSSLTSNPVKGKRLLGGEPRDDSYAKVVHVRVQQWETSGCVPVVSPRRQHGRHVEGSDNIGKKEYKNDKWNEKGREEQHEMRANSCWYTTNNSPNGENNEEKEQEEVKDDRSFSSDEEHSGEGDEEYPSEQTSSESHWRTRFRQDEPNCRVWKRESLLLPLSDNENRDPCSLSSSAQAGPDEPLLSLAGLIRTAMKLLREMEPELLREKCKATNCRTRTNKIEMDVAQKTVLPVGEKGEGMEELSASSFPFLLKEEDESARQISFQGVVSHGAPKSVKQETPLSSVYGTQTTLSTPSAIVRSEELSLPLYPIRSIVVTFQYSKAKKYLLKRGKSGALPASELSFSQTFPGFFFRATHEEITNNIDSNLPVFAGCHTSSLKVPPSPSFIPPSHRTTSSKAGQQPTSAASTSSFASPVNEVFSIDDNDEMGQVEGKVRLECRLPERKKKTECNERSVSRTTLSPLLSVEHDQHLFPDTLSSTYISSFSLSSSSDVESVVEPDMQTVVNNFFNSGSGKPPQKSNGSVTRKDIQSGNQKPKKETAENDFILID